MRFIYVSQNGITNYKNHQNTYYLKIKYHTKAERCESFKIRKLGKPRTITGT